MTSALYQGPVSHTRVKPRRHALRYRVFMALLDLDELDDLDRRLWLFSRNRFNLISFHDHDHGDGSGRLRPWVEAALAQAGVASDGGPIRLLSMPRVLGHAFNPLSLYFCHGRDGALRAIVYQVNNTFGERHSYVIPATGAGPVVMQSCRKQFYVSPFMDMDLTYDFRIRPPGEAVSVSIGVCDEDGMVLHAGFDGVRAAFDDRALVSAWVRHPLLSLKVLAGIHWEALWIWTKGVAFRSRPPRPAAEITVVATPDAGPRRRAA